eukprot:Sspe_Gene.41077::Locus_19857_Transcript_1_1_Confidence_1.000_Length_626::g.41077::m.41077
MHSPCVGEVASAEGWAECELVGDAVVPAQVLVGRQVRTATSVGWLRWGGTDVCGAAVGQAEAWVRGGRVGWGGAGGAGRVGSGWAGTWNGRVGRVEARQTEGGSGWAGEVDGVGNGWVEAGSGWAGVGSGWAGVGS